MAVELTKNNDTVVLRSAAPVIVTIAHWGEGTTGKADEMVDVIDHLGIHWMFRERPNGKPRYKADIYDMPIARFMVGYSDGREVPVFVTPGGTAFKVEADLVELPADLEEQAEAVGLLPKLEPQQQEQEDLSRELSEYLGTKVKVRISDGGKIIIGGELNLAQKMLARGWLSSRLKK